MNISNKYQTSDEDFKKLVPILRLAVPYTGMILTAREAPDVRKDVMQYGVSQIDGGTKLELGSYSGSKNEVQNLNREQFKISDDKIPFRCNRRTSYQRLYSFILYFMLQNGQNR